MEAIIDRVVDIAATRVIEHQEREFRKIGKPKGIAPVDWARDLRDRLVEAECQLDEAVNGPRVD